MKTEKKIDGHHVVLAKVRDVVFVWIDGEPLARHHSKDLPPEERQARFSTIPWATKAVKMELARRRKPLTLT